MRGVSKVSENRAYNNQNALYTYMRLSKINIINKSTKFLNIKDAHFIFETMLISV